MSRTNIVKDVNIIDPHNSAELLTNLVSQITTSVDIYFESDCKPIVDPG